MKKIKNEKELIEQLKSDINNCEKQKIIFFAGHFPLIYTREKAIEAITHWGKFSTHTLELACKLAKYVKNREVAFVFFVDDHMYEETNNLGKGPITRRRNRLYKLRSGKNAKLPEAYKKIIKKFGFSEKDVIRQNQGKTGREDCLYFSEKILRATKKKINNPCAREYIEFLEDKKYFNKKTDYIISFIPNRCKANICEFALDKEIKGLSSSHVFMDTMVKPQNKKDFYTLIQGVTYRKN